MSKLGYFGSFERENKTYYYRIVPLDTKVLVVASVNLHIGDWSAYIGAVEGYWHVDEWDLVRRCGSKLDKHIAFAIFPELANQYRWRD